MYAIEELLVLHSLFIFVWFCRTPLRKCGLLFFSFTYLYLFHVFFQKTFKARFECLYGQHYNGKGGNNLFIDVYGVFLTNEWIG